MSAIARVAALLIRFRLRHLWNGFRARPTGAAGLIALVALGSSVAYVCLFAAAFEVIGRVSGDIAQTAALALMASAVALSGFGARASAGDAVLAGTPENEFLLARPVSMATLVAARSWAAVITDPFGALFLFPVLMAAAIAWRLPPAAWAIAAAVSVAAQLGIASAAQAAQIVVVRWVPRRHRSSAWVVLRLASVASLAAVWMSATWILRAPSRLAPGLVDLAAVPAFAPALALVAPLAAFRHVGGGGGGGAAGLVALLPVVGGAVGLWAGAILLARRAGMWGWEEAGAPWADSFSVVSSRAPLTPARREWRILIRDRARLAALIALPAILVGVQIFGTIGWRWSTATVDRVAVLTFSVTLYMATLGPLGHMQTERRAFWIMRAAPVSLHRLMAAKAGAWAIVLGAVAAVLFISLVAGVAHAAPADVLRAGFLVVGGTAGMTVLAIGSGCLAADLSDDQRSALGPGRVYLFLLVGGLYNLVLRARGSWLILGLALQAVVVASTWRAGIAHARICLDAEALARRSFRLSDAATLLLIAVLGPVAVGQVLGSMEVARALIVRGQIAAVVVVVVLAAIGMAVRGRRAIRPRAR
ncbi:MAG: hypothetical protein ABUL77_03875 [Bacteroidota bacterium]